MTAREAKKACKTEGLVVWAGVAPLAPTDHTVQAWTRSPRYPILITLHATSWPLAVAAFKGWRAEWLKGGAE